MIVGDTIGLVVRNGMHESRDYVTEAVIGKDKV